MPLRDQLVGTVRPLLLLLYGAVGVVLLVACGNVANLLLMRGASRERELTIRAAIGAGRGRIARQLLVESTMLALGGGALGVVVAWGAMRGLVAAIPVEQARQLPYLRDVTLDTGMLGYALLVALVVGALSGVVPAVRAARAGLQGALRRGTAGSTGGAHRALRDGLVVAQLAFAVVLLSGAALFAGSLARLLAVDTGFRAEGVLTMQVPLPRAEYASLARQRAFYLALEQRVAALPGAKSVGFVSKLPLDAGNSTSYAVAGVAPRADGREPSASFRVTSPGYFRTLGIPLLAGRTFAAAEDTAGPRLLVINRAMAREAFGDVAPDAAIGRRIAMRNIDAVVIGVVGDVTIGQVEDAIPATMYWSWQQSMEPLRLAVRTTGDPHVLAAPIRTIIRELDPAVATWQVYTMDEIVGQSQSVFLRRYPMLLVGAFALVALVLALVGTYGVVSYTVAQRVRELGIRIALGARPQAIRGLVLRDAGAVAALGVGLGLVGALALARVAASLFYGMTGAAQPGIVAGAALLLGAMAIVAALVPAARATRADPLAAMKGE